MMWPNVEAGRMVLLVAPVLALLAGCSREERRFRESPGAARIDTITQSDLRPGRSSGSAATQNPYEGNAWAAGEGKRLYQWFNCNGCHFNGGGGIGPPLMDEQWIYGSNPANIFATIVEGRPNGMPAFRGKINDQQVWQIVTYVRSLSELAAEVRPSRGDHMNPYTPSPVEEAAQPTKSE